MNIIKIVAAGSTGSTQKDKACQFINCSGQTDFSNTLQTVLNWIFGIIGIVAVIMIILGGFSLMTSSGDPGKVKKGKDTILYGIIGLVVALLAFAIVNFVLVNVFKTS